LHLDDKGDRDAKGRGTATAAKPSGVRDGGGHCAQAHKEEKVTEAWLLGERFLGLKENAQGP
jgi:hypothetical protein